MRHIHLISAFRCWIRINNNRISQFFYRKGILISNLPIFIYNDISDVEASEKLLANLPLAMRNAIGLSIQTFFSIYGFLAYLFTFVTLAGAVQAMNLAVGLLSKEDSGKTADFLLTKPIRRSTILTSKLAAALSLIVFTNLIFCSVALITALAVSPTSFDIGTFLLVAAKLILLQVLFLALGMFAAVVLPKIKSSITVALPAVFGLFIVGTIGTVLGIDEVKYVSPFKFFDSDYIISHNTYDPQFLVLEAVIVTVAIIV